MHNCVSVWMLGGVKLRIIRGNGQHINEARKARALEGWLLYKPGDLIDLPTCHVAWSPVVAWSTNRLLFLTGAHFLTHHFTRAKA